MYADVQISQAEPSFCPLSVPVPAAGPITDITHRYTHLPPPARASVTFLSPFGSRFCIDVKLNVIIFFSPFPAVFVSDNRL